MGRVAGKVALVTGAAGAFGSAITAMLVREGASVVATDLADTIAGIDLREGAVLALAHDVTSAADWAAATGAALERFGTLDILVNNAGIAMIPEPQDPETVTLDHWRIVNRINVEGVLLGCQAAIAAMKGNGGGTIVNISSIAALNPSPRMAAYGASKAAVRHLTRSVALHCADRGYDIRCNSVHPGWIPTTLTRTSRTEAELAAQEKSIPMRRFGEPDDVASAVLYLASDESRYVTGAKITVDGGVVTEP